MKRKGLIITLCVLFVILGFGLFYIFGVEDKDTSLTVAQKKWIENNKNKVIDLAVFSGVPVINNNGNGIVFDFLDSLEKDTGLEFNKLSYTKDNDSNYEYSVKVSSSEKNSILLYKDNYALITKKKKHFKSPSEIKDLKIGVLKGDIDKVSVYLDGSSNLSYTPFENVNLLLNSIKEGTVDGVVLPKLDYLEVILNNNYHIAYNIFEYEKNYVLTLGSNKKLNKILVKYFENYKKEKYEKSLNKYFADSYFTLHNVDEREQTSFRSRRYSYGFVINPPYETTVNGVLKGLDYSVIDKFSEVANIEIDYKRYSSIKNMLKDFNSNKLDFISSDVSASKFDMDTYKTVPAYDNKAAIVTRGKTDLAINNVSSLSNQKVLAIKNSLISKYLSSSSVKTKEYDNIKDLIKNLNNDEIAVIDDSVYDYYVRSEKALYKIGSLDFNTNYGFISRDIKNNKTLNEFFDFYLSFYNIKSLANNSFYDVISFNNNIFILQVILILLVIILTIISLILGIKLFKKKKKYDVKLSKTDKLRYIDSLTSLKNRKYLNDNISNWDSSEVYPQSIIIIDLNNVAYINDNFGHAEGDKVIALGAGILINNQLSDSEIVRTNGNEFLIFTIGHDEKTIISYIRKLNKEFNELSHGFGAAIGYSMINDEIKTIDDAINEATIDMRNNKEEVN